MDENKSAESPIPPNTPIVGGVSGSSLSIIASEGISESQPSQSHRKTLRIINISYAAVAIPNVLLFVYGISSGSDEDGAGWATIAAAVSVIIATITWSIILLIIWFIERKPKATSQILDVVDTQQKRKAYISLAISLSQCVLFAALAASLLLIGKIPERAVAILLLLSIFVAPVLSWLAILGVVYAIKVLKTPYKNIGLWALALQAVSLGAIGIWALIDSML